MAKDRIGIVYNDSRNPGIIRLHIGQDVATHPTMATLTVHEAAQLSQRLAEVVRASGYDMVARKSGRNG